MKWNTVSVDAHPGEEILACDLVCPPDEHVQDFYDRVNATYADCERHWRQKACLLVKRVKIKENKKRGK